MKKYIYTLAAVLLFATSAMAQKSDEKAQDILEQVSKNYRSCKTLQGGFELSIENQQEDISETKKGNFYIKGDKFKIDMGNERVICNGIVLWTHLVDLEEVQITDYDPTEEDVLTPNSIFTIYEEGYNYKYIGTATQDAKTVERIDLYPLDKEQSYFKIEISIDQKTKLLTSAKIFDKNGNFYTYTISKLSKDKAIADAFFNFDKEKYPKVEEIDLRG